MREAAEEAPGADGEEVHEGVGGDGQPGCLELLQLHQRQYAESQVQHRHVQLAFLTGARYLG